MFCGFIPFVSPVIRVQGIDTVKVHFSRHLGDDYAFVNVSILPEQKLLQSYHASDSDIACIMNELCTYKDALLHMADGQIAEVGYQAS